MKKNITVISSGDAKPQTRKSPADLILEELGDEYMSVRQIAQRYGMHTETIRRLIKATDKDGNKRVKAPSAAVQQGGLLIYLFTKDDVEEMDEFMKRRGYARSTSGEDSEDSPTE